MLDKKEEMECLKQIKAGDKDKAAKTKRCHEQHQPRCPPPKNCWFAFLGMCKGEITARRSMQVRRKEKPKVDESEPEADSAGTGQKPRDLVRQEAVRRDCGESGASGAEESGASGAADEDGALVQKRKKVNFVNI